MKWVPLLGEFEINDQEVLFKGKIFEYQGGSAPTIGNILASEQFSSGTIEATIVFDEMKEYSAAELILTYDPRSKSFLLAGIGGFSRSMFDIRDFRPAASTSEPPWTTYEVTGDRANLKPNTPYRIKASVIGSIVTLQVDGVNVLSTTLPYPLPESHVGLWLMGDHNIRVTDFKVSPVKPKAFIVMEFSSPFNEIYEDVIKKVCEQNGLEAVRADDIYGPGLIIADVVQEILEAKVIIADVTPLNANVFFEVGYAFAQNKPTILLAEKLTQLPFDLSAFRVLFYENSIAGKAKVEESLEKHLHSILGSVLDDNV